MDENIDFIQLGETLDSVWDALHRMQAEISEVNKPESRAIEIGLNESIVQLEDLHGHMSTDLLRVVTGLQVLASAVRQITKDGTPAIRLVKR